MRAWAGWTLIGASLLGLAINLYFISIMYPVPRWFARALGGAARACGVRGGACERAAATPYARLFGGHPNVVVGTPWCLLTIVLGVVWALTGTFHLWWACAVIAAGSVAVGAYLTYVLLFVLKDP